MFSDTIKNMALRQLADWMKKEGISEVKIWADVNGTIQVQPEHHPHRFISTREVDEKLKEYRQEFTRLREEIRHRDDHINSLKYLKK